MDKLQNLVSINFAQDVEHDTERLIKEVAKWICVVFTDADRHDDLRLLIIELEKVLWPRGTDEALKLAMQALNDRLADELTKAYWPDGKPEKASAAAGTSRDPTDTEGRDKSAHSKDDISKDKETQAMIDKLAELDTLYEPSKGAAGATPRASGGAGGK